ncbi:MAG TPA: iron uptake system protein EfeO [Nocardioides sp.]|jgi:iron uptake system component EfeO|nr:iron uptake system protein EfeO [Nocardioides sp.]
MRFVLPVTALATIPLLAACTSNTTDSSGSAGAAGAITVTSSDDSCEISTQSVPAGNLTFNVTNAGSKVTEFYLYSADGKRIVGEVENIGPGLQGKLIVTANEGTYQTSCRPGMSGKGIRADFTVTEPPAGSQAPSEDAVLISKAQNQYRVWVQEQADLLVDKTERFVTAYKQGDDAKARALYPRARFHWESIETVAESFGDLDPKTDAREADLAKGQKWTGWHRIEKDLWPQRAKNYRPLSPQQRTFYGDDLLKNVTTVRDRIRSLTFTIDQIANGSSGLMEEVATGKVTGEEEYWSHTDLWDFAANVKGSEVAFEDVKPILEKRDPALAKTLTHRFTEIDRLLAQQKTGNGYRLYTELSKAEIRRLADAVNGLSEPLSHLTAAVLS